MAKVGKAIGWVVFGFGTLLGLWGWLGTLNPPVNGGYEVTRAIAGGGAVIALTGLGIIVIVRQMLFAYRRIEPTIAEQTFAECTLCARPLNVENDPMSGDCGGDCWGCIGKIEADEAWQPSVDYVQREIGEGWRFPDGTAKPAPTN